MISWWSAGLGVAGFELEWTGDPQLLYGRQLHEWSFFDEQVFPSLSCQSWQTHYFSCHSHFSQIGQPVSAQLLFGWWDLKYTGPIQLHNIQAVGELVNGMRDFLCLQYIPLDFFLIDYVVTVLPALMRQALLSEGEVGFDPHQCYCDVSFTL